MPLGAAAMRDAGLQSGFSVLELIVALALAAASLLALATIGRNALQILKNAQKEAEEVRVEGRLYAVLADLADAYSSSPLPNAIKIHSLGGVQFADGSLVPFSNELKQLPSSEAVSAALVKLDEVRVLSFSGDSPTACDTTKWNNAKTFIGLSNEGWAEVIVKPGVLSGNCGSLELEFPKHSIFTAQISRLDLVQKVAPAEIFSFYLSSKGELRRLMHVGSQTTENQPVFGSISNIKFTLESTKIGLEYFTGKRCNLGCTIKVPLRLVSRPFFQFLVLR